MEKIVPSEEFVWNNIIEEAKLVSEKEPALAELFDDVILSSKNLFEALAARIARKLGSHAVNPDLLKEIIVYTLSKDEVARKNIGKDIVAICERDPACSSYLEPLMYFKGFQSISAYRVSHILWKDGRKHMALYFQSLISEIYAVDIHPAARFGGGILLDHATSFVAGETSVVEDDVSILHEVTLGGTGTEFGDRHPKVHSGVLIGAGAKLIGNIEIGTCAKIGAGSVVLNDVAERTTVAGVPAKPIGLSKDEIIPCKDMNQNF